MVDRRLSPRNFDNTEPLVSTRFQLVNGNDLTPGSDIPDGLEHGMRLRLWMAGRVKYKKDYNPTPIADAGDKPGEVESEVTLSETGSNGIYTISMPWADEPLKVRGKKKAQDAYDQIVAEGPPLGWIAGGSEVTVQIGEAGTDQEGKFIVAAPWLGVDQREVFDSREEAELRQHEIHAEGAPAEPEIEPVEGFAALVIVSIDEDKFILNAPWLDGPEEFDDAETAEARQAEVREAGPPEGWEPDPETEQASGDQEKPEDQAAE